MQQVYQFRPGKLAKQLGHALLVFQCSFRTSLVSIAPGTGLLIRLVGPRGSTTARAGHLGFPPYYGLGFQSEPLILLPTAGSHTEQTAFERDEDVLA